MPKFSMTKQKFINQWLRHFAKSVTKEQLKKHVDGQFIWHVFSFKLIRSENLLVGDLARQAYDQASKEDCIFCDMLGNGGVTDKLSSAYDTAEKVDDCFAEFYVVAKDYSWTYIKTHEGENCGPFFLNKE